VDSSVASRAISATTWQQLHLSFYLRQRFKKTREKIMKIDLKSQSDMVATEKRSLKNRRSIEKLL